MKLIATVTLCVLTSGYAFAESDAAKLKDDAHHAATDTSNAVKRAGRSASDEACPLVNGKVKCAAKKMKHRAQNAADKVTD